MINGHEEDKAESEEHLVKTNLSLRDELNNRKQDCELETFLVHLMWIVLDNEVQP